MGCLVIGVFAAVCAMIYWLLIRHQTKKMIKQIQESTDRAINEMKQDTRQFINEMEQDTRQLMEEISELKETPRSNLRR